LARDKTATPRRSLRILPRARGTIAVIFVALLIEAACHAFLPFSAGFIVDHLTGGRERDLLLRMLMALGGAFFVSLFIGLLRDSLYAKLQSRSLAHIRLGMFERLQHFSIAFHAVTNQEDVLESFAGDLGIIESAFSMTLTWGALPAMESLFYTGVILWIDWRVGLLSLLVWPWVILAPHAMSKEVNKISESCRDEEVRILAVVEESLTARLVIRAFSLEHMGLALFRKRNELLQKGTRRASWLTALMDRFTHSGILFIQVAILALASLLTFDNQITAGKLVSIPILTWLLSEALLLVSEYRPALAEAKIAWGRILGMLRDPAPVPDARDPKLLAPLHHEIVFHDVSFSYGEDAALTDVTAKIAKGTHTALVGPAGAGKSTMLRLLMRLQDPQKGSVLIDEVPIRSVSQSSLRSRLGVVLPENFIFNASVRENIRLSQPDASEEKLRDLAKALGIVESPTQLPRGLDTVVGENGFILSGEMRQRVALARALLRNPDVLLLDEIGAQLDPAEEIAIHKTLQAITGGRTVISATHRLSTASDSHLILVMNDTKIVEQGTHAELLALDGFYAGLWRKQSGFTFSEDGRLVEADPARLKLLPIFEKIPDEMLVEMAPYFVAETFPAGREIVARGDPGDRFYVIVRGVAEVWRAARESEADGAEEELVSTLDDGDCFGEMALLTDLPRAETVRTSTVCTCISLGRGQFDRVVDKSPELRQLITETTARLLRESIGAATA
jgi:ATP-binding cassette subfamily B protein